MTEADPTNQATDGGAGAAPAAAQEQMVPKHRLDEVLSRVRQLEGDMQVKDQFIGQLQQGQQPQPANEELNAEELGIDESTVAALNRVVDTKLDKKETQMRGLIAQVANQQDEIKFLQKYGTEKSGSVDQIRRYQLGHYQKTGVPIDMEHAYAMLQLTQKLDKSQPAAPATPPAPAAPGPADAPASPPPAAAPQVPPAPAPAGPQTPPAPASAVPEESLEEQEARLNASIPDGGF